jgi:hypothetical protein
MNTSLLFKACADKVNSLNLTIATQVHILEPQWNPSIESQAIGRALRLTQKNVVTVTRYITENTIEEVCTLRKKFNFKTENSTASSREAERKVRVGRAHIKSRYGVRRSGIAAATSEFAFGILDFKVS